MQITSKFISELWVWEVIASGEDAVRLPGRKVHREQ